MQIYCPIFLDMERKQYICTRQYRYYIEQNPKLKNPNLWHYLLEFLSDKERLIWLCITLNSIVIIALVIKIIAICLSK